MPPTVPSSWARGRRRSRTPTAIRLCWNRFSNLHGVEATTTRIRRIELSPAHFLQLALVSLGALWLIVVTGAAVRVTDSGLGCRHWPGCEQGHPLPAKDYHAFIEFGNRALGGVVIALVLLTAVSSFFVPGLGRRWLAPALFVGTLAQAPLGYLAVHSDLHWPVVAAHLLLSMALLAGAVVLALEALALRSGRAGAPPGRPGAGRASRTAPRRPRGDGGGRRAARHRGARDGGRPALGRRRRAGRPALALAAADLRPRGRGRGLRGVAGLRAGLPRLAAPALAAAVLARPGRLRRAARADGARGGAVPDAPAVAAGARPRRTRRRGVGVAGRVRHRSVASAGRSRGRPHVD